ncbi:hypothetical protein PHYBOEH_004206 [Phytophthora boehmeriae]|uniref:Uncharacterized protein n=1 Tax=Phytophthora boehmeriae TaxID=109152 RepID=A0A8T1WTD7_9STRA|nr:hypothetical protein PHYBOEH_004206 [Phytophthora boehmeriae]
MSNDYKPFASELTQAAGKTGTTDSFRPHHRIAEEEQQTQSMVYAARMTYLDGSDQKSPDPLFLTRKQAQKMALQQQESVKMPMKIIETRKIASASIGGPNIILWKKGRASAAAADKRQTWEPRFQAGCHFYECLETGECRVFPDGNPLSTDKQVGDDGDEDDPPFPDSFAFLNDSHR